MSFQVKLSGVSKRYLPNSPLVFKPLELTIAAQETIAIVGPSGCGKTSLLNMLGLLDEPSIGRYEWCGQDVQQWSPKQRALIRNQSFGYIFQANKLINHYTVLQNCALPLLYRGLNAKQAQERVQQFLAEFNMLDLAKRHPKALSGGQQQRVGIIRALISQPQIILADEPTSALDDSTKESVLNTIFQLQSQYQFALILVTHDMTIAQRCTRQIQLEPACASSTI